MRTCVLQVRDTGRLFNVTTLTARLADNSKTLTGSLVHLYGSRSRGMGRNLTEARPLLTHKDRPRGRRILNDNYCVDCVAGKTVCVHVTSNVSYTVNCVAGKKRLCPCNRTTEQCSSREGRKEGLFVCSGQERDSNCFTCKFLSCCNSCSFCKRVSAKEKCKSREWSLSRNKICQRCVSCVDHLSSVICVTNLEILV